MRERNKKKGRKERMEGGMEGGKERRIFFNLVEYCLLFTL